MQFLTEALDTQLRFSCPKHPDNNHCQLCGNRESDEVCICEMCSQFNRKHEAQKRQASRAYLAEKMCEKLNKRKRSCRPFQDILQFLLWPHHKTITHALGVFIPEVCFYRDGEVDALYCNGETNEKRAGIWPPQVLKIKKQKLNNTQIQKILNQKRRKYTDRVSKACNLESSKLWKNTLLKKKSNRKFTLSKQKPSAKNASQKLISPKQSPTKKSVKKVFGLQNKQQLSSESKDAVIICMTTRDETYEQLRDENYFLGLMLRRKQDPIFKPIDFIKNFVGVEEEHRHTVFCKHEQGRTRYPQLFQRSKSVIRAMGSNIIAGQPKYVSPEEEALFLQHLANKNLFHYAYYTLYKIISYVEAFHDEKITLISAKFLINQLKELYLLQVYSLKRHELTKYTWNQETYLQKVADNENKLLMRSPQKELDSTSQQKMSLIQKQMRDQYQQLKNEMGLGQVQHNDRQYYKNNAFFAILHPELTETIGEILKDKTMTVKRFQAKYLGYKDAKKSVAVDFNSSLVKTVHKMSPALRTSKPHQLQNRYFPKTASIQRPAGTRPASIANTISTLNRSAIFL